MSEKMKIKDFNKKPIRKTLSYEKLVELYNFRFEIEEELDVLEQVEMPSKEARIRQINMQLTYIDNIITIGENDYTKQRFINVKRLSVVLKTLQKNCVPL